MEDTSAKNTNLVRNMKGGEHGHRRRRVGKPGSRTGDAKDRKIAELEKRKGREARVVREAADAGDEGRRPADEAGQAVDARAHAEGGRAGEGRSRARGSSSRTAPGTLRPRASGNDGERAQAARKGGAARQPELRQRLRSRRGRSVAEKRAADGARAESSHSQGRWDKVQRRWR